VADGFFTLPPSCRTHTQTTHTTKQKTKRATPALVSGALQQVSVQSSGGGAQRPVLVRVPGAAPETVVPYAGGGQGAQPCAAPTPAGSGELCDCLSLSFLCSRARTPGFASTQQPLEHQNNHAT
jgi:hypothetical protein